MAEKLLSFNERVVLAQEELKAPKSQYNSFGKYNYRNAEDILEAVKPINKKHGLMLVISDEPVMMGTRYYIKAEAKLFDVHSPEFLSVTAYAREEESKKGMDGSQVTGASSSYARKYALNGLYLIDDTKDADTDENHKEATGKQKGAGKAKKSETTELSVGQTNALKTVFADYVQAVGGDENDKALKAKLLKDICYRNGQQHIHNVQPIDILGAGKAIVNEIKNNNVQWGS